MVNISQTEIPSIQSTTVQVRALAVGMPTRLGRNRQGEVISGIRKTIITGDTVRVGMLNIEGDGQADLRAHGGVDKAVYCYPSEHARFWEEVHGYSGDGEHAPFGENLVTEGMTEKDACIGDIWRWGDAVLQVSQPRWPCYKLVMHTGFEDMVQRFVTSGRSGWYLRVLEPGMVPVSGPIELVAKDPLGVSVHLAFDVKTSGDKDALARVMAHPLLAAAWRR
ncbi:MAG: MOSC domain-containing protein [Thermomicrobiales bacterium]